MKEPLIRFTDVNFIYAKTHGREGLAALQDVNLEIFEGEFAAVLGHNGSGKSTLAKHVNALLSPTSGQVVVAGLDTSDQEKVWEIRQKVGMVFQNPDNQLVATTVEEDVAFGPENLGIPSAEIQRRVTESLKTVDMLSYRLHSPHQLSGGQKQRVAIAGVISMLPKCIVLDEPTAMLDPEGRNEVMSTIHRLNREEGITVLHITHHMDEVIGADRVIVMDEGRIVLQGTPREVFSQVDLMRSLHLDVPQVTDLAERLRNRGYSIPQGTLTVNEMVMLLCPSD
ncbi:MAG TPA: energy-coupling factor transporter ATPase [Firmicutes bacterium]|jgi:energy-coupling factor transport system ATP-binding protein|nr:energy-coupling factor transporter ATPase [Bacillota bacterium]